MKKRMIRLAALMLTGVLLSGCTLTERLGSDTQEQSLQQEQPQEQNETSNNNFGMAYYEGENVNPVLSVSRINRLLCQALYEGLFQLDNQFQPQPVLCQSYSGDGVNYTFTLKSGITFWSGAPVRASDVVYSYQTAQQNPNSPYKDRVDQIKSIRATGDLTLEIILKEPNTAFPTLLDIPIFRQGTQTDAFAEGCGPYQPQSDGAIRWLIAYSNWHGGYPADFSTIQLTTITSADAIEYSFETGDISIARAARISATPTTYKGAVEIYDGSTTDFHYLGVNCGHAPYQIPQVRRAISLAIDRNRLRSTQLQGFADAAILPVNPQPAQTQDLAWSYEADGQAALQLLSTVDISDTDGDGQLDYYDTRLNRRTPLAPVILVNSENSFKVAVVTQIIADLERIGIRATMKSVDFEAYQTALTRSEYDLYYGETITLPDFDMRPLLATTGALNYGACGSTQLDTLISQTRAASGDNLTAAKNAYYTYFLQNMPILPIAFARDQVVLRGNMVKNFECLPYNLFYSVNDWMR